MALTKTFAAGQILTANDVNTHLAHQVPNAGDPYDTGWVTIPQSALFEGVSGSPQIRRIGVLVYLRGLITATFPANANLNVMTIPDPFRPLNFNETIKPVITREAEVGRAQANGVGLFQIRFTSAGTKTASISNVSYFVAD